MIYIPVRTCVHRCTLSHTHKHIHTQHTRAYVCTHTDTHTQTHMQKHCLNRHITHSYYTCENYFTWSGANKHFFALVNLDLLMIRDQSLDHLLDDVITTPDHWTIRIQSCTGATGCYLKETNCTMTHEENHGPLCMLWVNLMFIIDLDRFEFRFGLDTSCFFVIS